MGRYREYKEFSRESSNRRKFTQEQFTKVQNVGLDARNEKVLRESVNFNESHNPYQELIVKKKTTRVCKLD